MTATAATSETIKDLRKQHSIVNVHTFTLHVVFKYYVNLHMLVLMLMLMYSSFLRGKSS